MLKSPITPTVSDHDPFIAEKDAEEMRTALTGPGTDEAALIRLICKRSNAQRQAIMEKYKSKFDRNLIEDIESDTSGHFCKVLIALLKKPIDFVCSELNEAISKKDGEAIIDLLCGFTPDELHQIEDHYSNTYRESLTNELSETFPDNFKFFAVGLFAQERDKGNETDLEKAKADIKESISVRELKLLTEDVVFARILCHSNPNQVKLVLEEYKKRTGTTMQDDIKKHFTGIFQDSLLALCECAKDTPAFYAAQLRNCMRGLGTDDDRLMRIIVLRAEVDLQDIKDSYLLDNQKSLDGWIKGDTSGDYRDALLALL